MLCAGVQALMGTALMFVMMAHVLTPKQDIDSNLQSKHICLIFIMLALTLASILPPLYLIFQVLVSFKRSVSDMDDNSLTIQKVSFIASLLLCACYFYIVKKIGARWISAVGFISSILLAFNYANSLYFIAGKNTGLVNISVLRSMTTIDDIECNSDYMLVKVSDDEKEPTAWRCPTVIALMKNSSVPFIPYPDYTSGSSVQLSVAIHELMKNSEDLSKK